MYALAPISQLAQRGFSGAALLEIERTAFIQSTAGLPAHASNDEICRSALECLPRGEINMLALYTQNLAMIQNADVNRLQAIAGEISTRAGFLERRYEESMARAQSTNLSFAALAEMQGAIAESYADVIQAAEDLKVRGVIAVSNKSLQALTEPLDGPLKNLHPKAMSIIESRSASARQVMRA